MTYRFFTFLVFLTFSFSCKEEEGNKPTVLLELLSVTAGTTALDLENPEQNSGLPIDLSLLAQFDMGIDENSLEEGVILKTQSGTSISLEFTLTNVNKKLDIQPSTTLTYNTKYDLVFSSDLRGDSGESFEEQVVSFTTVVDQLSIQSLKFNGNEQWGQPVIDSIDLASNIAITFSRPIAPTYVSSNYFSLQSSTGAVPSILNLSTDGLTVTVSTSAPFKHISKYSLLISSSIKGTNDEFFSGLDQSFYTSIDTTPKFPLLSDEELLTLVQQQTFKYFYDFAHPASGMARERNTSGDVVTSGGSGFGIMALIVGIERNFITRQQGIDRMKKIVSYLETADRFHGAWAHWMNGNTGDVIPFSTKDNGGDLVETSFLVQGLLTFRQYLQPTDTVGNNLINRITTLWEGVEWDWYRRDNQQVLYWHWSPNYNWDMNFAMYGYFEQQITYFLAAASPTHSIPKSVYTNGFARNGAIVRNDTYYSIPLKLGGLFPLFWVHYSYVGLDPHFSDAYANYWEQNVNASLINQAYCIDNPRNYVGYAPENWGLTSSDNQSGYNAHSPANDLGVITPTAALSSFPYTPTQSMQALKFFYYTLGDRLWGTYGFYDAFNLTQGWTANSYLAIDQGPIILMIENYRTGLLWDLFMSAPEVQAGFTKLEFTPTN